MNMQSKWAGNCEGLLLVLMGVLQLGLLAVFAEAALQSQHPAGFGAARAEGVLQTIEVTASRG